MPKLQIEKASSLTDYRRVAHVLLIYRLQRQERHASWFAIRPRPLLLLLECTRHQQVSPTSVTNKSFSAQPAGFD